MGALHRRARSSPDPSASRGYFAALARAAGLYKAPVLAPVRPNMPDDLVDVGFASAVMTDDSADDSGTDDRSFLVDGGPSARRRRRAASSSFIVRHKPALDGAPATGMRAHERLAYLDLQGSLPLALASLRHVVLAQLAVLEERLVGSVSLAKSASAADGDGSEAAQTDASRAVLCAHVAGAQQQLHLLLARMVPDIAVAPLGVGDLTRKVPAGVQALPNHLLGEASAALAGLKGHLDAAADAVRSSGSDWQWRTDFDLEGIRARTAAASRVVEERLGEWGVGAREAVSRARDTADTLLSSTEARLYDAALELASEGRRLITYADLPFLWRNNEYILTGYRFIPVRRWPRLVRSTFEWHNETLNVWTHLLGIVLVACAPWIFPAVDADRPGAATTPMDKIISWVYLGAAIECMAFSVSWHVMAGCSDFHYFNLFACVDYTGIGWLISASVWTVVYNLFYAQPNIVWAYVSITFLLAVVCTVVPFIPWFNERRNKGYRIAIFVTLAGFAVLPIAHAAYAHGVGPTLAFLAPVSLSIAAYVTGLLFYATHFPESAFPGTFDYVAHAHQIWHAAIVIAVLLHYRCVQNWHIDRAAFASSAAPSAAHSSSGLPFLPSYQDNQALLGSADAAVYAFRQSLGSLAGGAVGRVYSATVAWVTAKLS